VMETLTQGDAEIRLAASEAEVRAAQALRYRVFYDERGAKPSPEMAESRRDFDPFDDIADHLLVLDRARGSGPEAVVGTYRMLRRAQAEAAGGFYTADEYDIRPILELGTELLEVGRSCVDAAYRNKATMQLLWRGIAAYVFHHDIGLLFGCASFLGTDPAAHALPLSYLHHHHLAPPVMRPRALPERHFGMDILSADAINPIRGLASLPPLIKGYLRLGGYVGEGAVVDHQFNTTDVCVIVKTDLIAEKYFKHYDRTAR